MKIVRRIMLLLSLIILPAFAFVAHADAPPDPGSGGPGGGDLPVGGGAPIGGGLITLVILGSAYGIKKTLNLRNKL